MTENVNGCQKFRFNNGNNHVIFKYFTIHLFSLTPFDIAYIGLRDTDPGE